MIKTEIVQLLAQVAAYDRRTVGEADVEAWHTVLADIPLADAVQAVSDHYRRSRDWIMPAEVLATARRLRGYRLEHAARAPHPDVDPNDVVEWLAAYRRQLRAIADGQPVNPPATALPTTPTPALSTDPHEKVTFP